MKYKHKVKFGGKYYNPGEEVPETLTPSEEEKLGALKAEADALGVEYHPNIGAEKLEQRIAEHRATLQ